jgi:hypothetical protein
VIVAAGLGLAAAAAGLARGAADVRSEPVRFSSVLNGSVRSVPAEVARAEFRGDTALVLSRIGDVDILLPLYLGESFVPRLERTPWSSRFLIAALIRSETTGYSVRVKKVAYQRVAAGVEQFCVIASVRKPGRDAAVERRKTTAYDVVSLPRAPLGRSFTPSAVLRDDRGRLLSKGSSFPSRPARCRP